MSKQFYKKNPSQPTGATSVKSYKFDDNLNTKNYVDFILNLRNNESIWTRSRIHQGRSENYLLLPKASINVNRRT